VLHIPSVLRRCYLGGRKGIWPVKKLCGEVLAWLSVWHLHMAQLNELMPLPLTVSCFSIIQTGFTFLVPAHPGSPGQRAVKRVCVCVCIYMDRCRSYETAASRSAGVAAKQAGERKSLKYAELSAAYEFQPVAVETRDVNEASWA